MLTSQPSKAPLQKVTPGDSKDFLMRKKKLTKKTVTLRQDQTAQKQPIFSKEMDANSFLSLMFLLVIPEMNFSFTLLFEN